MCGFRKDSKTIWLVQHIDSKCFSSSVSVAVFLKHTNRVPSLLVLCISYPVADLGVTSGSRGLPALGKRRFSRYFYNYFF